MQTIQDLSVNPASGEPLVEQLHRQLVWLIASGQLKPGDSLPSVRRLAQQLSINMHTVRSAYLRLEKDVLVSIHQGASTQVLELDPRRLVALAGRTRTYTIGVILPGLSNPFYHEFLQGVQEVIHQEQLMLFVCDAHEDPGLSLRYFAQLSARNVDGILFASNNLWASLGQPNSASLPVVNVDTPGCPGPVLNFDLEEAGYQAVRHLLTHGHRRVGQISFSERSSNVLPVEAGYARALAEAGVAMDESLIVRVAGFDMLNGESGAQQLLGMDAPPTAIFAIADMLALGVMKAVRKAGKRIPEDVALASVDDIALADLVIPGLTTVSLPARPMGVEAMRMLQNLIEGKEPAAQQITLPGKLVIRQSCGCR
jgi:DNA-binding LacI/PurR family transcriptional regulator